MAYLDLSFDPHFNFENCLTFETRRSATNVGSEYAIYQQSVEFVLGKTYVNSPSVPVFAEAVAPTSTIATIPTALEFMFPEGYVPWTNLPDPGATPTTITVTARLNISDDFLVDSDEVLFASEGATGLVSSYDMPVVTNNGTMWIQHSSSSVIGVSSGNIEVFFNTGTLNAFSATSTARAVYFGSWGLMQNAGTVRAISYADRAIAYETYSPNSWGRGLTSENTGLIEAWSGLESAYAVYLRNGGDFLNTGTIRASGMLNAIAFNTSGHRTTLINSGLIEATTGGETFSVAINNSWATQLTIINTGFIRGDYSIYGNLPYTYPTLIRNGPSGVIEGDMWLNNTPVTLINFGQIIGDIFTGSKVDVFNGVEGIFTGTLDLGDGNDIADMGATDDIVYGGSGNDTISGSGGNDAIYGGADDDVLSGGAGDDQLFGGDGDDIAVYNGARSEYTITNHGNGVYSVEHNNAGIDGTDTLIGIERLQFSTDAPIAIHNPISSFNLSDLLAINGGDGSVGTIFNGIDASDYSGRSVSSAGDVNGDGFDDILIGALYADNSSGESYVVFGTSIGLGASFDLSDLNGTNGFVLNGIDSGDQSGVSVSNAGDINGDGHDDILIGAWGGDMTSGETYVIFGSNTGFTSNFDLASLATGNGSTGFAITGVNRNDASGYSVSSAGDVNGDGYDDILIGAYLVDSGHTDAGESYVIFGQGTGFGSSFDLATLVSGDGSTGFVITGDDSYGQSGYSVSSAGDINGDGYDDILIGAPLAGAGIEVGQSYVVFGSGSTFVPNLDIANLATGDGSLGFVINGIIDYEHTDHEFDNSGWSVSNAGDINGDGYDDIIIGAPQPGIGGVARSGESYVVFGSNSGFGASLDLATLATGDGSIGFAIHGAEANDRLGVSVSSAGDINGDGYDDLLVGAESATPEGINRAGTSYVIFGTGTGFSPVFDLATLTAGDGTTALIINGINSNDFSGHSLSGAGDVNGDGYDDILIGADQADPNGNIGAGETYLIYGSPDFGPATIHVPPNEAPINDIIDTAPYTFTQHDSATLIAPKISFSDVDNTNLEGAVIAISQGFDAGNDSLVFVDQNGITGVYNAALGTLTLSGTASLADYNTALQSIRYLNAFNTDALTPRTFSFTVSDGTDSSAPVSRTFTFELAPEPADLPADASTTALLVVDGDSFESVLEDELDVDWIGVDLSANETTVITLSHGWLLDSFTVVDATGSVIGTGSTTDFVTTTARVEAPTTGRYYVVIGENQFIDTPYNLVASADTDLPSDSTTTGTLVAGGADYVGEFNFVGDTDWIAIDITAHEIVQIQARGIDAQLVFTSSFTIVDAAGNLIQSSFTEDAITSRAFIETAQSGTFYINISDDLNDIGQIGEYILSAVSFTDDHRGTSSTLSEVFDDTPVTGIMNYVTDEDWFSYQADQAMDLNINLAFHPWTYGDIELRIIDDTGSVIATLPSSHFATEGTIYLPEAGTYYISVRVQNTFFSGDNYTLEVTDFSLHIIDGTPNMDTLSGDNRDDIINGLAGNDILYGFDGDDQINGGAGNDQLWGGAGADVLDGGDGTDFAYYRDAQSGITLNTVSGGTGGDAAGDTYISIERFSGSQFDDHMSGGNARDVLYGLNGDDVLSGAGGNDVLYGQAGEDHLTGGTGNDRLFGGAGADALYGNVGDDILNGGTGDDYMSGGTDNDQVWGGDGTDTLLGGDGDDALYGGDGNDTFWGGSGADVIDGGAGIDRIMNTTASSGIYIYLGHGGANGDAQGDVYTNIENAYGTHFDDVITGDDINNLLVGLNGNDSLVGEGGNDRLIGGNGDDVLSGGTGNDILIGQAGADTYYFDTVGGAHGADKIIGWEDGIDIIEYNQSTGITDFSDLTITQVGANTLIEGAGITGTILVIGATAADFSADDFNISSPFHLGEAPAPSTEGVKMDTTPLPSTGQDIMSVYLSELPIGETYTPISYTNSHGVLALLTEDDASYCDVFSG